MNRRARALGVCAAACATWLGPRVAAACGGCFHPPPSPTQTTTDITDERMLLAVSPQQSTLYDQIVYSGNPSSFAWVLPIKGSVTVGLSADVLFDSVDALTATQITAPPSSCPAPPTCGGGGGGGCGSSSAAAGEFAPESEPPGGANEGTVTVTKQQIVGPYETVQLSASSPTALSDWLSTNGFDIPSAVQPILAAYQSEGFGFLAMKLEPGQGVQAMRPVRVTSTGASLSLPLRMASIGAGATVGITIWVVSDGRYEPQNFPFFHIDDSQLVWDWNAMASNYTTLRQQEEAQYNGRGWEIESALALATETLSNVIESGGVYAQVGSQGAVSAQAPAADASQDYDPVTDANGNVTETADQVRTDDINALFAGLSGPNAFVSRMRSDVAHAAMDVDFAVEASTDQSQLSNVRTCSQSINETCTIYGSDCSAIGTGTPQQASTKSGSGSCAASRGTGEPPVSLAAIGGILGLIALRPRRKR